MLCELCPRKCRIDRSQASGGCHAGENMRVAAVVIHQGEEPPLTGGAGSGAVFFSGCPLMCSYCQNRQISHAAFGPCLRPEDLAGYFLKLQEMGCANINLVSATHFAPELAGALALAKEQGLRIPVMLNSSGYESVATLEMLKPYIHIYQLDLKYGDNETGRRLSRVADYWDRAREALAHAFALAGPLEFDSGGQAQCGLMVRHLVLPGMLSNPFAVLEFVAGLSTDIPVSLLAQYNPDFYQGDMELMQRRVTPQEYQAVVDRALELGFETIFGQDCEACQTYNPDFTKMYPFNDQPNLIHGLFSALVPAVRK